MLTKIPDTIMFKLTKFILYISGSSRATCGKVCMVLYTIAVATELYMDFNFWDVIFLCLGAAYLWYLFNSVINRETHDGESKVLDIQDLFPKLFRIIGFWAILLNLVFWDQAIFRSFFSCLAFYFAASPTMKRTLPGDIRKLVKNLTPSFGKPVAIPVGARSHNGTRSLQS